MDLQSQHANAAMVWMDILKDAAVHVVCYPSAGYRDHSFTPSAQYLHRFLATTCSNKVMISFLLSLEGFDVISSRYVAALPAGGGRGGITAPIPTLKAFFG